MTTRTADSVTAPGPLHGTLTVTGYELPEGLSYEEWAEEGSTLVTMARASMWWVGDWLAYGEHHYGEKYAQAVEATGLAVQTLKNAQWVCDRIPPRERVPDLPFSHHKAVAALDKSPRRDLLKRAVEEGMTEGEVRGRVRALKGDTATPAPDAPKPPETLETVAPRVVAMLRQAEAKKSWDLVEQARIDLSAACMVDPL